MQLKNLVPAKQKYISNFHMFAILLSSLQDYNLLVWTPISIVHMQGSKQLTLMRLQREEQRIKNDPIPGIMVQREGHLDFHFVIYGLNEQYKGGFYHGLLKLHENYPFAAPKLFFFTRNGRFEVNVPICTSFTNYHQESWTSAWNVRSLLLGTVSFMTCNQDSYGCRNDSKEVRKKYAAASLQKNVKNPKFIELFWDQLEQARVRIPGSEPQIKSDNLEIPSYSINENLIQQQNVPVPNEVDERRNRNFCTRCKILILGLIALIFYLKAN